MDVTRFPLGDPVLIENIVNHLKARGIFDQFRHDSLADVDTKPSYQNLSQRVDGFVSKFLSNETWNPDQNKNELRNKLRRQIDESGMLALGVDHVVEQVINPKIFVFSPKIREVVEQYLGLREIPDESETKVKRQQSNMIENKVEKQSFDSSDVSSKIAKSDVSDPISQILALSDTSSKHKKIPLASQTKISIPNLTPDSVKLEKKDDDKPKISVDLKSEAHDQAATESSTDSALESKGQVKKEYKLLEHDASSDNSKKCQKTVEFKREINSGPDISSSEDSSSQSGTNKSSEFGDIKSDSSVRNKSYDSGDIKSDSSAKNKSSDSDKIRPKLKTLSSQKVAHVSSEVLKFKSKESVDLASPSKISVSKPSIKTQKTHIKDHVTPTKSPSISKSSKEGKVDIEAKPNSATKTPDASHKKSHSSITVSRKDTDMSKYKTSAEKSENRAKSQQKTYSDEHVKSKLKSNSPISSSYESSQGSDQDKDFSAKTNSKERRKLFSKGSKIESEDKDLKKLSDKSRTHKSPGKFDKCEKLPSTEKRDRSKGDKVALEKQQKLHASGKSISRSDSTKSSSSIGNSTDSSKETSYHSTESDAMYDSSSSKSDMDKKKDSKKKKHCREDLADLNPPLPPPPPPPALGISTAPSTSSSPESEESLESDNKGSSDESSSDSSFLLSNSEDNITSNLNRVSDVAKIKSDSKKQLPGLPDIFLESSSDDEFNYFSTPEKLPQDQVWDSDVTVSSVHTSDLSSYENESSDLSEESDSKSSSKENEKRKFTFENVGKVIHTNLKKRRRNGEKDSSVSEEKIVNGTLLDQISEKSRSDEELPSLFQSKRGSRRERKLNPKYASEEYASIFNSSKKLKSINPVIEAVNQNDGAESNANAAKGKNKAKAHAQIQNKNSMGQAEINDITTFSVVSSLNEVSLSSESKNRKNNDKFNTNTQNVTSAMESNDENSNDVIDSSLKLSDKNVTSESDHEFQNTNAVQIKPKNKVNNSPNSKVNYSSFSASAKGNEISSKNTSLNVKYTKISEVSFVENTPNENQPVKNSDKRSSNNINVIKNHKRLRHDSQDNSFTTNLKRCKSDSYETKVNNSGVLLSKGDNVKN